MVFRTKKHTEIINRSRKVGPLAKTDWSSKNSVETIIEQNGMEV